MDSTLNLTSVLMFRSILPGWRYDSVQRDAGEYVMLLLEAVNMLQCVWRLGTEPQGVHQPQESGGTPLMMQIPAQSCSLQAVIDLWHNPAPGNRRLLYDHENLLVIQLDRYNEGNKKFTDVAFADPVTILVCSELGPPQQLTFEVVSAVFHTGQTVHAGHYQALLKVRDSWRVCDDAVCSRSFEINSHVRCNVYLLFLKRAQRV